MLGSNGEAIPPTSHNLPYMPACSVDYDARRPVPSHEEPAASGTVADRSRNRRPALLGGGTERIWNLAGRPGLPGLRAAGVLIPFREIWCATARILRPSLHII